MAYQQLSQSKLKSLKYVKAVTSNMQVMFSLNILCVMSMAQISRWLFCRCSLGYDVAGENTCLSLLETLRLMEIKANERRVCDFVQLPHLTAFSPSQPRRALNSPNIHSGCDLLRRRNRSSLQIATDSVSPLQLSPLLMSSDLKTQPNVAGIKRKLY